MTPQQTLVKRLTVVFGEPRTDEPALFIREIIKSVEKFSEETIQAAGDELIKTAKFWPRPAEIVEAATAAAIKIAARKMKPMRSDPLPPEPTPEQKQRMRELVRQAAEEMSPVGRNRKIEAVTREKMEALMRASPNRHLHADPRSLTTLSKRMSGERHDE